MKKIFSEYIHFFSNTEVKANPELFAKRKFLLTSFILTFFITAFDILPIYYIESDTILYIALFIIAYHFVLFTILKIGFSTEIAGNGFVLFTLIAFTWAAIATGGLTSAMVAWFICIKVSAFWFTNRKTGYFWSVVVFIVMIVIFILQLNGYTFETELSPENHIIFSSFMHFTILIYYLIIIIVYENGEKEARVKIERQRDQLEEVNQEVSTQSEELQQANEELSTTLDVVNIQKAELQEAQNAITDSVIYASRIQNSILPLESTLDNALGKENYFVMLQPRNVVSGDFYWYKKQDDCHILAVVDCTGHGVPGAFMSMLGSQALETAVTQKGITTPHLILEAVNKIVRNSLQQSITKNNDGMDMSLISWKDNEKIVQFAGAKNPVIYIQEQEIHRIKGDKYPIGGYLSTKKNIDRINNFTTQEIEINSPTTFYLFSDGYQDQFGGNENRKFQTNNFRNLLFEIHNQSFANQKNILQNKLENWMLQGAEKQTDDIVVVGIKIG